MNYYIYLIRNQVNNKVYIGKRKCPSNKIPQSDNYMGSGKILKSAIKKYGIEVFEKQILVENVTNIDLINSLEREFIAKFESTNRSKGYNRTNGGHTTRFFSEEEMEAYRDKFRNKIPSEETRKKLSEKVNIEVVNKNLEKARSQFKKLIESGWRPILSKEDQEKRLDICKRMQESNQKKILCITTNTIYQSMSEAAEKTNSSISKISLCCSGKRNKTNNLQWQFLEEKANK